MRFTQIVLTIVCLFAATQAFAHHDKACKKYFKLCMKDPSVKNAQGKDAKKAAIHDCVSTHANQDKDAGKDVGTKCVAEMAAHEGGGAPAAGGDAPPAGAAPAAPAPGGTQQ